MGVFMKSGSPFLYDEATKDIVGVKDQDGGETLFGAAIAPIQNLTGAQAAAGIDATAGDIAITLSANTTLGAISGVTVGREYKITFTQNATGGYEPTLPAQVQNAPSLGAGAANTTLVLTLQGVASGVLIVTGNSGWGGVNHRLSSITNSFFHNPVSVTYTGDYINTITDTKTGEVTTFHYTGKLLTSITKVLDGITKTQTLLYTNNRLVSISAFS